MIYIIIKKFSLCRRLRIFCIKQKERKFFCMKYVAFCDNVQISFLLSTHKIICVSLKLILFRGLDYRASDDINLIVPNDVLRKELETIGVHPQMITRRSRNFEIIHILVWKGFSVQNLYSQTHYFKDINVRHVLLRLEIQKNVWTGFRSYHKYVTTQIYTHR